MTHGGDFDLPRRALGPGDLLAGCRIERELGRGGMGAVYQGRTADGRLVALKVMLGRNAKPTERERFRREADAYKDLRHPGIVELLRAELKGPQPCMVMELVEGGDLEGAFARGELSLDERLELVEQVCHAVQFAHSRGILHRDLKPANVLIDTEGRAKVTDFGIGRDLDRETRLTVSGTMLGTLGYMSPEQALGEGELTSATDVFSLGVMLYEAITGELPFSGGSQVEVVAKLLKTDPKPPSKVSREAGPAHDALVARSLAKAPADRLASALELAAGISALRRGETGAASARLWATRLAGIAVVVVCAFGATYVHKRRGPTLLGVEEVRARSGALRVASRDLLVGSPALLTDDADVIRELAADLSALRAESTPAGLKELDRLALRIETLQGLLALAEGDSLAAAAVLERVGGGVATLELRALRGGLAAFDPERDATRAAGDLSGAIARGARRAEVRAWRAAVRSRSGLAGRADEVLADLEAVERVRPLGSTELQLRIAAQLEAGAKDAAALGLAQLADPPLDLRWSVALAWVEVDLVARPKEALARLKALPAQDSPVARRRELARAAYQPANDRVRRLGDKDLSTAELKRLLALCALGRHLWPGEPLAKAVRDVLLEQTTGYTTKGGLPKLAAQLADLTPNDFGVHRAVGFLSQRIRSRPNRVRLIPVLRRAGKIAPTPEERVKMEVLRAVLLGQVNSIHEGYLQKELADECLSLVADLLSRVEDPLARSEAFAARASVLAAGGDYSAALEDLGRALGPAPGNRAHRFQRMVISFKSGDHAQALADAVFFTGESTESSKRNDQATALIWDLYRKSGDDAPALRALSRLLKARTNYAGWFARRALILLRRRRLADAKADLDTALSSLVETVEKAYQGAETLAAFEAARAELEGDSAVGALEALCDDLDAQRSHPTLWGVLP
jgi:tetratricopeptide (TPR) repeat protein